jgi:hypothetical protein
VICGGLVRSITVTGCAAGCGCVGTGVDWVGSGICCVCVRIVGGGGVTGSLRTGPCGAVGVVLGMAAAGDAILSGTCCAVGTVGGTVTLDSVSGGLGACVCEGLVGAACSTRIGIEPSSRSQMSSRGCTGSWVVSTLTSQFCLGAGSSYRVGVYAGVGSGATVGGASGRCVTGATVGAGGCGGATGTGVGADDGADGEVTGGWLS